MLECMQHLLIFPYFFFHLKEPKLIVGSKYLNPSADDGPFGSIQYQSRHYPYDFVFHADWADLDRNRNLPGVFTLYDLHVTLDVFPVVQTVYCLNVGPLMALSEVEVVFLVTIRDGTESGARPKVGLLRASRMLMPIVYLGERPNRAVFGVIANGDMSIWNGGHPRMEATVRVVFPEHHSPPPASLIDFKSNRLVACVPSLFGHASISPYLMGFPSITRIARHSTQHSRSSLPTGGRGGRKPSSSRVVRPPSGSAVHRPDPSVAVQGPSFGDRVDAPSYWAPSFPIASDTSSNIAQSTTASHSVTSSLSPSYFFPRIDYRGPRTSHHVPADNGGERYIVHSETDDRESLSLPGSASIGGSWFSRYSPPNEDLSFASSTVTSGVSAFDQPLLKIESDLSPSSSSQGTILGA